MTGHDDDLRLVAAFREDLDDQTPERLSSVRAEFLKGRNMNARKSFFTPRRIAVVALPAVAAIALGAVALSRPGNPTATPPDTPATSTSSAAPSEGPEAPDRPDTSVAKASEGKSGAEILALAAENARYYAPSYDIADGNYVYRHTVGEMTPPQEDSENGKIAPYEADEWFRIDLGFDNTRLVLIEGGPGSIEGWDKRVEGGEGSNFDGPGLLGPTREWIAGLPTDAKALHDVFVADCTKILRGGDNLDDEDIYSCIAMAATQALTNASPIMTVEQRAVWFETLSDIPGVTRTDGVVKDGLGRKGVAIGWQYRSFNMEGARQEIIVDPVTSEILGQRTVEADGTVTYVLGYEQKIVGSADEK